MESKRHSADAPRPTDTGRQPDAEVAVDFTGRTRHRDDVAAADRAVDDVAPSRDCHNNY